MAAFVEEEEKARFAMPPSKPFILRGLGTRMDSVADSCEQEAAMSVQEWSFMLFVVLSVCPLSLTTGNNFVNAFPR